MGSKVLPGSEEITLNTSEEPSKENQRSSSRKMTAKAMPRLLFRTSPSQCMEGNVHQSTPALGSRYGTEARAGGCGRLR